MTERRAYAEAGVDIAAGNALVDRIKPVAAATARPGTMDSLGGFAALFDPRAAGYHDPVLLAAADGVGTKLRIAIESGGLSLIGIDLDEMYVYDLICHVVEPAVLHCYVAAV